MATDTKSHVYEVEMVDAATGKSSRVRVSATNDEQAQLKASSKTGLVAGSVHLISDNHPAPEKIPAAEITRGAASMIPMIFSGLALVIAAASLFVVAFHDPLGKGMSAYDFTTPEAATASSIAMEANHDFRAHIEIDALQGAHLKDAARTLDISRVADFGDKKIVFASFLDRGRKVKKLYCFEKELESKLWLPRFISPYSVKDTNEQLAKDMEAWEEKSHNDD